jgi:hypothetical protein
MFLYWELVFGFNFGYCKVREFVDIESWGWRIVDVKNTATVEISKE